MEKTVTLNLRVSPDVKHDAEQVLKQLGIPMSTAIDMYLRQISMQGGIPFPLAVPKTPASINADSMSTDELHAAIEDGYTQMRAGQIHDAGTAFKAFREAHK